MSRLLFAAARGARIQFYGQYGDCHTWAEITRIPLEEAGRVYYRIHPDDAHLAYGPVSTALRWEAEHYKEKHFGYRHYTSAAIVTNSVGSDFDLPNEDRDGVLFLLILAEALADEGL